MKKLYVVTVELELYVYTAEALTEPPPRYVREAVRDMAWDGVFSMEARPATGKELGADDDEVICTDGAELVSLGEALAELEAAKPDPNQGTLPGVS